MTQTQKKLSIKPLGNRVVAQRLEQEETLKGGIILPDSAKKKQETAKVVAVGPGQTHRRRKTPSDASESRRHHPDG